MIQPHELMIGNYVHTKTIMYNYVDCEIVAFPKEDHVRLKYNHDESIVRWIQHEIKPILLNKEWLIGLGFEPKYNYYYHSQKAISLLKQKDGFSLLHEGDVLVTVEYVHQLQNLYLSLAGEQLKIKEDANS